MSKLQPISELLNVPFRLSPEEKDNPLCILENFLIDYKLGELRNLLTDISDTCLSSDAPAFDTGEKRANFLYYRYKLETLFEAVFVIVQQKMGQFLPK
jgi:hypothetical protein